MRYRRIFLFLAPGLFAMLAYGQSKPDLTGKWQLSESKSSLKSGKPSPVSITIEEKGSTIHIVKMVKEGDKEKTIEFKCTTDGKDCDADGEKISLWYNGASLVEMDIGKDSATKLIMKLDESGKALDVDVDHISPQAESDKLVMEKG